MSEQASHRADRSNLFPAFELRARNARLRAVAANHKAVAYLIGVTVGAGLVGYFAGWSLLMGLNDLAPGCAFLASLFTALACYGLLLVPTIRKYREINGVVELLETNRDAMVDLFKDATLWESDPTVRKIVYIIEAATDSIDEEQVPHNHLSTVPSRPSPPQN